MAKPRMKEPEDQQQENRGKPMKAPNVPLPKMRRGVRSFYRDVIREMKHVHWPTRRETNRLTGVVLAVCAITAVILTVLSYGFQTIFELVLRGK